MHVTGLARIIFDLLTKSTDMDVHGSHVAGILVSLDDVQKVLSAVDFVRVEDQ